MNRCPTCGHKLIHLFYSSVCDNCTQPSPLRLYYAIRGPAMVGPRYWSPLYITRDYAESQCMSGGRVERVTIPPEDTWLPGQLYLVGISRAHIEASGDTLIAWLS